MKVNGTEKPDCCINPNSRSCRGCIASYDAALYDGGCRLAGYIHEQDTDREQPSFYRRRRRNKHRAGVKVENIDPGTREFF